MSGTLRQLDGHSFLILPENRLAVAALKKLQVPSRQRVQMASRTEGARRPSNQTGAEFARDFGTDSTARGTFVTIVGPAGTGKSHLARDLLRLRREQRERRTAIAVTASEFAAQFAEAAANGAIAQFQTKYRGDVPLFICEDIQMLGPRKETQIQLIAALDDILAQGGNVLFTSTQMPGEIKGLSTRLANRIRGGVLVNIDLPEMTSRQQLIEHFLTTHSVRLRPEEIELIAAEYPVSPRELLGLLTRLMAETARGKNGHELNVQGTLKELTVQPSYTVSEIAKAAAKRFGVSVADLKSPVRSHTVSQARQTAMFLAREMADLNYATIGDYFNRRNHSTVIHACQKIAAMLETDPKLANDISAIRKRLVSGR